MDNIKWHEVTWYSKILAIILLLIVVPVITFFIGKQYEETVLTINDTPQQVEEFSASGAVLSPDGDNIATTSSTGSSGIEGLVTLGPECTPTQESNNTCQDKPYVAQLTVKDSDGKTVTNTVSDKNGRFSLLLAPGTYTVEPIKTSSSGPTGKIASVTVTPGTFIRIDMNFVDNTTG